MRVTKKAIILGCPSYKNNTGRITIYLKKPKSDATLELIADVNGPYVGA